MAQLPESQRRLVEEAVQRDLPGWKVSDAQTQHKRAAAGAIDGLSVKRVGDLEQLRKKFLGGSDSGAAEKGRTTDTSSASTGSAVRTVVVESLDGRTKKVADVINGRATIVQG